MGFIKEDVRLLNVGNIDSVKVRINRYANFIARVIYDMKWYDPPVQTIRSPIFVTDLNKVLRFLVENVFQRISTMSDVISFSFELDENLPIVHINEFVVWEVFEPIIQNCIDHAENNRITITISTSYDAESRVSRVRIIDNGAGIAPWLLEVNEEGIKPIFLEHTSTKSTGIDRHVGYGCYIAREIARARCGWDLDAENVPGGGCVFTFTIPNSLS